jgi:hypothetical protein
MFFRLKEASYNVLIPEPNHSNVHSPNNGRREDGRYFRNKRRNI